MREGRFLVRKKAYISSMIVCDKGQWQVEGKGGCGVGL